MNRCPICKKYKISSFLKSKSFQVLECKYCYISFTYPKPALPDYKTMDFHSKESIGNIDILTSYNDLPIDWQGLIDLQINLVLKYLHQSASILEIGCGEGILLDSLRSKGYSDLEGFEPSYTASKRAIKRGLTVHNCYFDKSYANRKFDLVVMSHVLEHVENPTDFLIDVRSVLKPGGGLLLTQTNYKGLIPRIQKDNWYAWVPDQHFWHFTPKYLKILFNKIGFKISKISYSSLVHPNTILYKAAKIIPSLQDQFILYVTKNN